MGLRAPAVFLLLFHLVFGGYPEEGDHLIRIDHVMGLSPGGQTGHAKSYKYPDPSPGHLRQRWAAQTFPASRIKVTCDDVRIPAASPCEKLGLKIEDGDDEQVLCGNVGALSILSKTSTFSMSLSTGPEGGAYVNCTFQAKNVDESGNELPETRGTEEALFSEPALNTTATYTRSFFNLPDSSEHGGPPGSVAPTCPCGWANKESQRIVGGKHTDANEYPFITTVTLISIPDRQPFCGASLITDYHAITAAHCTDDALKQRQIFSVVAGLHNHRVGGPHAEEYVVQRVIQHEAYDPVRIINDISLLVLNRKVNSHQKVGKVCLPNRRIAMAHQYVKIIGWGRTVDGGSGSHILKSVDVKVIPPQDCVRVYRGIMPQNPAQICTYRERMGACQGDSGGPVVWLDPDTNRYTLVGLVSYGRICGGIAPTVHTEVGAYLPWIQAWVQATIPVQMCYIRK